DLDARAGSADRSVANLGFAFVMTSIAAVVPRLDSDRRIGRQRTAADVLEQEAIDDDALVGAVLQIDIDAVTRPRAGGLANVRHRNVLDESVAQRLEIHTLGIDIAEVRAID